MKSRLSVLAALFALAVLLSQAAVAQTVYVSNKPFPNHVNLGGQLYVPFTELMSALRLDWDESGSEVVARAGTGVGYPLQQASFTLKRGTRSADIEGIFRGDSVWVPLRAVAPVLAVQVRHNPDLEIVDVVANREISDADRKASEEVAAAREAQDKAINEAWDKKREQIRAERKAREEAEAAAAAAAAGEETAEGAEAGAAEGGAEGTFPAEMAGKGEKPAKPAKPEKAPAAEEKPATPEPAKAEEKPAEPKPVPEAKLLVIRPTATTDNINGTVACSADVRNNGDGEARNIRATVTLTGPDGKVWDRQNVYQDSLASGSTWTVKTSYRHPSGPSMPRGTCTVSVDLQYDKK